MDKVNTLLSVCVAWYICWRWPISYDPAVMTDITITPVAAAAAALYKTLSISVSVTVRRSGV